jgi:hypothetical protein
MPKRPLKVAENFLNYYILQHLLYFVKRSKKAKNCHKGLEMASKEQLCSAQ